MSTIILKNLIEVSNRLEELGWTVDQLLEVVEAMVAAKRSCTENDPPAAPGWSAWRDGTRRLREIGRPLGWEKDDTEQIASIVDQRRGMRIAVSNTDDGTGLEMENRVPQNRCKKGAATDRVISANQGSFMDILDESITVIPLTRAKEHPGIIVSWYLCVYCEGEDIRAELSCPVNSESGYFSDFVERIILIGSDGDGGVSVRRRDSGGDPEFDIPVTRK